MAELIVQDQSVVLRMNWFEKFSTGSGNLTFPRGAVTAATLMSRSEAMSAAQGWLIPKTNLPGFTAGRLRRRGASDLVLIEKYGPVLVLVLEGQRFQRLLVTVKNPEVALAALGLPSRPVWDRPWLLEGPSIPPAPVDPSNPWAPPRE
jgi:hypothetical protein